MKGLLEGRCATTGDSQRCFQASAPLELGVLGCPCLDETLGSAPPGECLTWVLAQVTGTLTDARRKERNRIGFFFFYVPLKLIFFLVILHITRVDG